MIMFSLTGFQLVLGIFSLIALAISWFSFPRETVAVCLVLVAIVVAFVTMVWYWALLLVLVLGFLSPLFVLVYKWGYFWLVDRPENRDKHWECFERYKYEHGIGCGYEFKSASRPAWIGSGYGRVEGEFVSALGVVGDRFVYKKLYADVYKKYTRVWPGLRGLRLKIMFDVGFREGVGALGDIPEELDGVPVWESAWNRELVASSGEPTGFLVYRISEGLAKCSFDGWGYGGGVPKFDGGFGLPGRVYFNSWWWVIRPFWSEVVGYEPRRYGDLRDAVDRDMAELVAGLYPGGRDDFEKKEVSRVSETSFRDVMEYEDGNDPSVVTRLYFRLFGR